MFCEGGTIRKPIKGFRLLRWRVSSCVSQGNLILKRTRHGTSHRYRRHNWFAPNFSYCFLGADTELLRIFLLGSAIWAICDSSQINATYLDGAEMTTVTASLQAGPLGFTILAVLDDSISLVPVWEVRGQDVACED